MLLFLLLFADIHSLTSGDNQIDAVGHSLGLLLGRNCLVLESMNFTIFIFYGPDLKLLISRNRPILDGLLIVAGRQQSSHIQ